MARTSITLYGKNYSVNCGPGEETRLAETVDFIETRMKEVEGRVGNTTDQRLLVLTCITLADELLDLRRKSGNLDNEELFIAAVEHLKDRVTQIASQVGTA